MSLEGREKVHFLYANKEMAKPLIDWLLKERPEVVLCDFEDAFFVAILWDGEVRKNWKTLDFTDKDIAVIVLDDTTIAVNALDFPDEIKAAIIEPGFQLFRYDHDVTARLRKIYWQLSPLIYTEKTTLPPGHLKSR